jgi:archaemetzincin
MPILIISIGQVGENIISYISSLLSRRFNTKIREGSSISLDRFQKDVSRNQYRSSDMLTELSKRKLVQSEMKLGVTDVDLYAPNLNFVFGEADPVNKVAAISLNRLHPHIRSEDGTQLFLLRAGKEAVHELGHVHCLQHCTNPECVMFFSNSLADTDRKSDQFCPRCNNTPPINN